MLPEIKPIHAQFAQPLEGKCMRPDGVNFSLSTSSEILSEKADLIAMEEANLNKMKTSDLCTAYIYY